MDGRLAGDWLLWTENNGLHWNDITPQLSASEEIDAAYFSDNHHAWTVIHQPSETGAANLYIGATSDGGTSWTKQPVAEGDTEMLDSYGNSGDISFSDSLNGCALLTKMSSSAGSYAGLFYTRDGGNSWSRLPDPRSLLRAMKLAMAATRGRCSRWKAAPLDGRNHLRFDCLRRVRYRQLRRGRDTTRWASRHAARGIISSALRY